MLAGDWHTGLRLLDQAINKLESVVDREGRQYLLPTKPAAYSNNAENLAMIYANTGNALSSQSQHAAALESYCKAATIFKNLVRQGRLPVTTLSMLYSGIASLLNHVERQTVQGNMIPHVGTNFVVSIYAFDQTGSISGRLRDAVADLVDAEHLCGLQQCLKVAERCFDHAVELNNKPSIAHYWRAMLYRDTGRIGEARRELASLTRPDAPSEFRQGASDALNGLVGLTFESINAGNLPVDRAALRIDKLLGNELRELLAVRVRPAKRWWQFWVRG